jgi:hypothetical protein
MRKAVPILALIALLAGCGGDKKDPVSTPAPTPSAKAAEAEPLEGYSAGVRNYYSGAVLEAAEDPNADAEVRYFQPPRPAEANVGDAITLTGSNIGVETAVKVTGVERVEVDGKAYDAIELELDNGVGGITVLDSELKSAAVTHPDGKVVKVAPRGVAADCSNGFDGTVRLDVEDKGKGCLLFRAGSAPPERLQLALETVPTDAGGIWNLR